MKFELFTLWFFGTFPSFILFRGFNFFVFLTLFDSLGFA